MTPGAFPFRRSALGLPLLLAFLAPGLPSPAQLASVLPATPVTSWNLLRPDATYAARSVVPAGAGVPFTQALRVQTLKRPAQPWDIQLNVATARAVAKDDVLEVRLWFRRTPTATQEAFLEFVFEQNSPPWTQSTVRFAAEGDGSWTELRHAFRAVQNHDAGKAQVNLRLGYGSGQTIDLGPVTLTNYARTRPLSEFPEVLHYPGRAADAPWRAAAEARIDSLRKADLTLEARTPDGRPAAGVTLLVEQTRNAFGFGTAVDGSRLLGRTGSTADRNRYQNLVTNWFNKVVLENDLKWPSWESNPPQGSNTALAALRWLRDHGLPVRGHNLIWPGLGQPAFLPPDLAGLVSQPAALARRIDRHFTNILTATRGLCTEWDVVNEPYVNHDLQDALGGKSAMTSWFKTARALAPEARLYLNEYGNLELAGLNAPHTDGFFADLSFLKADGAPLDGIGMQGHFGTYLPHPERLLQMLDRFATLGLPIQATEFDINTRDEQAQADFTRDFLTLMYSHPAVDGVLLWGFWEGQHWLPQGALFRRNWEPKPAALAWSNLVLQAWITRSQVTTGPDGRATLRGFRGDYRVRSPQDAPAAALAFRLDGPTTRQLTVSSTPPALQASLQDGLLRIQWPGSADDLWQVESTAEPGAPQWTREPVAPRRQGDAWAWTAPAGGPGRFYRLARPRRRRPRHTSLQPRHRS